MSTNCRARRVCLFAILFAVLLAVGGAKVHAAVNSWTNPAGGAWEIGSNWTSGFAPTNTDTLLITNPGTYTVTIDNTTADTDPGLGGWMTVQSATIGNKNGPPTLLLDFTNTAKSLTLTSTTFAGAALSIGESAGTTGRVTIANGTLNTTSGWLVTARNGIGTFTMNNGLVLARYETLGANAGSLGTMNMLGGTNISDSGYLDIGSNPGATGIVNVAGGYLRVTNGVTYIGDWGTGYLNVTNGNVSFAEVRMAGSPFGGGYGEWNIYGGTNRAGVGVNQLFTIGYSAANTAVVNVVGGLLTATDYVTFIGGAGRGVMNISSNGTFLSRYQQIGVHTGGSGLLTIDGGTNISSSGYFYVGNSVGSTGIVNLANGLLHVDFADAFVGSSGRGTINVSNGVFEAARLYVGQNAGSSGQLNISGGSVIFSNTYSQQALEMGQFAGATGTVNITGGQLVVTNLAPGTLALTNLSSRIGISGIGTVNVSNGTYISRYQVLGVNGGGSGTVNLFAGGSNIISGNVLDIGSNPGATGTINVAGGVLSVNPATVTSYIGDYGRGVINLSSGEANLGYTFMGVNPAGGSHGEWNISGGTGRVAGAGNVIYAGYAGGNTGVINVTGGRLELGQSFIGYGTRGVGELNVSGGSVVLNFTGPWGLFAGYLTSSTGTVSLTGGEIVATNSYFAIGTSGYGTMIISNGTFRGRYQTVGINPSADGFGQIRMYGGSNLMQNGYWDIGSNAGATGRVVIAGGYVQVTNGITYIGDWGRGFLTVSNGVTEHDEVRMGDLAGAYGQWDIVGGASGVNGPLQVGIKAGSTGLVQVANSGVFEIRSTTAIGNASGTGRITSRDGGTVRFTGLNNPTITKNAGGTFVSTNAIVEFKNAGAANILGNITNITLQGDNTLSLNNATNAILGTYTFQTNNGQNYAYLRMVNGTTRWQSTNLNIGAGGSLLASNTIGSVRGIVTNAGAISVVNSKVTFENAVTISGSYTSDPSTNTFLSDVTVSQSGTLAGGVGDLFDFKKSLFIHSTNRFGFDLDKSGVMFSGGGMHTNAITGQDFGTNELGYAANFAYGELHLGSITDRVCFTCGNIPTVASNGLYIGWLDLLGDTNLVANLHATNTINLYYDKTDTRNAYLGGLSYSLTDCDLVTAGGMLMPVVPEPSALLLFSLAAMGMLRRRRA